MSKTEFIINEVKRIEEEKERERREELELLQESFENYDKERMVIEHIY